MSARVVDREARLDRREFMEFVWRIDGGNIAQEAKARRKFEMIFGTPYGHRDTNLFDVLRQQETAVAAHLTDRRGLWPDQP